MVWIWTPAPLWNSKSSHDFSLILLLVKFICCRLEHFIVARFSRFSTTLFDFVPNPMVAFESWLQMRNQCHWSSSALICLRKQNPSLISTYQRTAKMLSSILIVGNRSCWKCLQSFISYRDKSSMENLSHMSSKNFTASYLHNREYTWEGVLFQDRYI